MSGMSTANCAYTSTPSAAINPISITAATTNIPGEAGLPGCNCAIYPDEQGCPYADYCDCGGMYAGLLTTSISGTSSLNVTLQSNQLQMTTRPQLPPFQAQQLRILHQVQLRLRLMRFPQLQQLRPGQTIRQFALGLKDIVRQKYSPAPITKHFSKSLLLLIHRIHLEHTTMMKEAGKRGKAKDVTVSMTTSVAT